MTGGSTTCRWGIIGAGWISEQFTMDLLIDPSTRNVTDIQHQVYAVASRDETKARKFIEDVYEKAGVDASKGEMVKSYGSYAELFADQDIDCVYVGTPHSHHYAHVHAALTAGKNVLCEKAFTANAAQTQILIDLAREKGLFLMEAVWTRFQPYAYKLQEVLASGVIGEIRGAAAELNVDFGPTAKKNPDHRLVNPDLCGGALLDLGPYPWTSLFLALMPPSKASNEPHKPLKIAAGMTKTSSGVDASTSAVIEYPQDDGRTVHGTLTTAQDRQTPHSRVMVVQGSLGYLEVQWATYRPESLRYYAWSTEDDYGSKPLSPAKHESFDFVPRPGNIWGFAWEADEVARCLRDGKKESDRMPLRDTLLMMQSFDEMRKQGQLVYPEHVETTEIA